MKNATFNELCGLIDRAMLTARMKVRRFQGEAENLLERKLFDSFELAICDLTDGANKADRLGDWQPLIEALRRVGLEFAKQEQATEFIEEIARERREEEKRQNN